MLQKDLIQVQIKPLFAFLISMFKCIGINIEMDCFHFWGEV